MEIQMDDIINSLNKWQLEWRREKRWLMWVLYSKKGKNLNGMKGCFQRWRRPGTENLRNCQSPQAPNKLQCLCICSVTLFHVLYCNIQRNTVNRLQYSALHCWIRKMMDREFKFHERSTKIYFILMATTLYGQNNFPKHVELTGIINKPLLLHLVGYLYYLYQWCTVKQISDNEIYLLIKYIKSVIWRLAKLLSYIEDARCLKFKKLCVV